MASKGKKQYPAQLSLILRVGCGAYLIYLAWGLRDGAFSGPKGILYGIALVLFALAGAALLFFSVRALARGEYRLPYETDDEPEDTLDSASDHSSGEDI